MLIKTEPSGTHVHKEHLLVRLDFYPEPGDKSYSLHHVQIPIIPPGGYPGKLNPQGTTMETKGGIDVDGNYIPPQQIDISGQPVDEMDYQNWLAGLPKEWVTNPCLSHFVRVKPDISLTELQDFITNSMDGNVIATIDDVMTQANSAHFISPYMRTKAAVSGVKVSPGADKTVLVETVNGRLSALSVRVGKSGAVK